MEKKDLYTENCKTLSYKMKRKLKQTQLSGKTSCAQELEALIQTHSNPYQKSKDTFHRNRKKNPQHVQNHESLQIS